MKQYLLTLTALAATLAACQSNSLNSGISTDNLDPTTEPGADFYQYATGGWQKANPLTAEYSRFGSFDVLQENNNKQLRDIIDSVAALGGEQGSIEQKIAGLYNSAMDSARLAEKGQEDLKTFLRAEGYGPSLSPEAARKWIDEVWPEMLRQGVQGLFDVYIEADLKDSKSNILTLSQGGITLRSKDYYLDEDTTATALREAYKQYIGGLCQHCGFDEGEAWHIADDVMRIETRLARASKSMTELRDPEANYN